jgi:uncharacterized protein
MVYCCAAIAGPGELQVVRAEVDGAGIEKPAIVAMTRSDEASPAQLDAVRGAIRDLDVVPVSILDETSLDAFRAAVWRLTRLIRVYLRKERTVADEPLALPAEATGADVADAVHHKLGATFSGARVWGPSARFAGQRVGGAYRLEDGDEVEILR